MKRKFLLVADQPGWILDRHCQEIQKRLTEFEIGIGYSRTGLVVKQAEMFDYVYVLDPFPMRYPPKHKTIMGLRNEFLYREHPERARGLFEKGFPGRCSSIADKCCIFHVVNKNLYNVFKDIVKPMPFFLAQHGVDTDIFNPDKYKKLKSDIVRVSVSGRSSSNKGFELVTQACKELHYKIVVAQYGRGQKNKEQMPAFYNEADVHVCMSKTEGLNNGILEAGAMGVPVISTRSGAAEEIIEDGYNGLLIDRNVQSLKEALQKLELDSIRTHMGSLLRQNILKNWSWDIRIEDYRKMFNAII